MTEANTNWRKTLVLAAVAGQQDGFREDYSHVDLVYGHHVREEIFPRVLGWLKTHDPTAS